MAGSACLQAVSLIGVDTFTVQVQACLTPGVPGLQVHGLPADAAAGVEERVRDAIASSGLDWPQRHVTVSLLPAAVAKPGTGLDLPVAVAVLTANGVLPRQACADMLLFGELGAGGAICAVPGAVAAARHAAATGIGTIVVPAANAAEARLVAGVRVVTARTLRGLVALLRGDPPGGGPDAPPAPPVLPPPGGPGGLTGARQADLADTQLPDSAVLALAASAAGGHHLMVYGAPGSGARILADRLADVLPPLDPQAELEVAVIRSVAGLRGPGRTAAIRPPVAYLTPGTGPAGLRGHQPGPDDLHRPGVVSLAHHGVLRADDLQRLPAAVLAALPGVLVQGAVDTLGPHGHCRFPARFVLAATLTPCPCRADRPAHCRCTPGQLRGHHARIPGRLLARLDLHVHLSALPAARSADTLSPPSAGDQNPTPASTAHPGAGATSTAPASTAPATAALADQVGEARDRARKRLDETGWSCNAQVSRRALHADFRPSEYGARCLRRAQERGELSSTGAAQVLRLAWTLADLDHQARPGADHILRALQYRRPFDIAAWAAARSPRGASAASAHPAL
ncbi:ATP-binding protein [Actinomadura graeca]|uniref:ATP-binding protein n=1 Tax=Actinomadura graeca TaxID=2750812 RepID=A0ABX8R555_9ACTN|nr:ATP-binding protein [Actinomadura graeca]QXJ25963.1 ATP-binding protein [Actinomadura graeca]